MQAFGTSTASVYYSPASAYAQTRGVRSRIFRTPLLTVPLAKRGNRTPTRFPSRSGGNLKEGGNINRISVIGSPRGSL